MAYRECTRQRDLDGERRERDWAKCKARLQRESGCVPMNLRMRIPFAYGYCWDNKLRPTPDAKLFSGGPTDALPRGGGPRSGHGRWKDALWPKERQAGRVMSTALPDFGTRRRTG